MDSASPKCPLRWRPMASSISCADGRVVSTYGDAAASSRFPLIFRERRDSIFFIVSSGERTEVRKALFHSQARGDLFGRSLDEPFAVSDFSQLPLEHIGELRLPVNAEFVLFMIANGARS